MATLSPKICDLCCHESTSWAVGKCDHPTCLRCTAKLRVLCDQRDCSVCRLNLPVVIVCHEVKPFTELSRSRFHGPGDKKHGILFKSQELYQAYETLRQNGCDKCTPEEIFRTFRQLRDHMNRSHDLHYCEICVDNLKLFPREFRAYTRSMLTKHRRTGDTDDTSHKGHPLCKFCDNRYLDNDVLHTHLRTDHLWCHICENDGRQDYYKSYPMLRKHFKEEHFLCEEGPCREEKLTSVFRSKIDIQAHCASAHTQGLSKAEVKQMRQLELGFSYGGGDVGRSRGAPHLYPRSGRTAQRREQEELEMAAALSASTQRAEKPKKSSPPLPKKSPDEETKPPPGFSSVAPAPQLEVVRKTIKVHSTTGFNPYSNADSILKSELSKPPGFENVTVVTKSEKKANEWPEIVAGGEAVKQDDTRTIAESELSGLQISRVWAKSEISEQKQSKKKGKPKNFAPERSVPAYTAEAFPSLSGKSEPQEKMSGDKISLSRKQVEAKIVERIRAVLDKTQFTEFKTLSGWYRSNEISAMEYMNQCSTLFGPKWEEFGPIVASVFPEERKQIELSSFFPLRPPSVSTRKTKSKKKAKVTASVWSSQSGGRPLSRGVLSDADYPSLAMAAVSGGKVNTGGGPWNMAIQS